MMTPEIKFMSCYHIETTHGTDIVPVDLITNDNITKTPIEIVSLLRDFISGDPIEPNPSDWGDSIEQKSGYYFRLSSPGYMDCTEWTGPFETYAQAEEKCDEMFEDD